MTRKEFVSVAQAITVEEKDLRGSGNEDDSSVVEDQFFTMYDKHFGCTAYLF